MAVFTTKELVEIGDYVHDCESAIIIAENPKVDKSGETNVLVTMKGDRDELINLFTQVMIHNQPFTEVVMLSMMMYRQHIINENK
jgi:hypothetical protein